MQYEAVVSSMLQSSVEYITDKWIAVQCLFGVGVGVGVQCKPHIDSSAVFVCWRIWCWLVAASGDITEQKRTSGAIISSLKDKLFHHRPYHIFHYSTLSLI